MLFKRYVIKETMEEVKAGDEVILDYDTKHIVTVVRMVEGKKNNYAVFSNGQWRPVSSYGKTWCKLGVN